jgi:hypothetical protein
MEHKFVFVVKKQVNMLTFNLPVMESKQKSQQLARLFGDIFPLPVVRS